MAGETADTTTAKAKGMVIMITGTGISNPIIINGHRHEMSINMCSRQVIIHRFHHRVSTWFSQLAFTNKLCLA